MTRVKFKIVPREFAAGNLINVSAQGPEDDGLLPSIVTPTRETHVVSKHFSPPPLCPRLTTTSRLPRG